MITLELIVNFLDHYSQVLDSGQSSRDFCPKFLVRLTHIWELTIVFKAH